MSLGPWVPGSLGPWVPGSLGPWVPGSLGPWVPVSMIDDIQVLIRMFHVSVGHCVAFEMPFTPISLALPSFTTSLGKSIVT